MERASFYEMLADERRGFTLIFGTEHAQTFAMDAAPKAVAAPEEEELALVRLSEPEDNLAAGIVDLALLAVQNDAPDLDRTVWGMVTSNVKTAVKVIHNVESGAESLGEFFAMEDRLEAKSNAHAGELTERAKARLEHMATDPKLRRRRRPSRTRRGCSMSRRRPRSAR